MLPGGAEELPLLASVKLPALTVSIPPDLVADAAVVSCDCVRRARPSPVRSVVVELAPFRPVVDPFVLDDESQSSQIVSWVFVMTLSLHSGQVLWSFCCTSLSNVCS